MASPEEIAGKWLLNLCSRKPSAERDQLLTDLEKIKFDEFFTLYGQSPVFKTYWVEAVRRCLAKELRVDYPLARALLEKDGSEDLFVGERDMLQVAIKRAKIYLQYYGKDPKKSNPELLEMVKLLMTHGAALQCLDDEGYSPLAYTCILGYEELFRFLVKSGADISTFQQRRSPEQLIKRRKAAKAGKTVEDGLKEHVNLLQIALDALISPQEIVCKTLFSWPLSVGFDVPLWNLDIEVTWGGIVMFLLDQGISCPKDDAGLVMMLHIACYEGALEFVKKLLAYGAAADVASPRVVDRGLVERSTFGTAMHAAAAGFNIDIAVALIEHGESASCRRHCILRDGSTRGNLTPIEVAIAAGSWARKENLLEFLEAFMTHASDLQDSDYQTVLRYCAQNNRLDAAKRLLDEGIWLQEVPTSVSSADMAKLLVSHGIKLDPASLQERALRRGRLSLLRWCVGEYGAKLPDDPKSWGEMVTWLLSSANMYQTRYLITEYPEMRKSYRGSFGHFEWEFEVKLKERLEMVRMLEEKLSGNRLWTMPSYEEMRRRVAQSVEFEKQAWDKEIEAMIKSRHSFRLLQLLPASNRTDPLVGRLIDSDITFQPDYEALSYVWGDITPVRYIALGDQDVSITPNLHSALIHLRSPDTVRTLWVDALCINQSVHGERNQQVRIMGDIYKSARQVVVWLGDAADDSQLVFQHLNDESNPDSFHSGPPPPEDKRRAWSAFVKRPWFFRTWVIQEIALAKRVVMMCGEEATLWKNLDTGHAPSFFFDAKGLSTSRSSWSCDHPIKGFNADGHVSSLVSLGVGSGPTSILRYSRVCQTTEVRDKIYGILGLFEPGFTPVYYDLPVEDIFRQFTEAVIILTKDLSILEGIGAKRSYPNLPSWVPDFTDTSINSLPGVEWYAPCRDGAEENYDVRCADGTQLSFPRELLGKEYLPGLTFSRYGSLKIKGKAVDTLREVGPKLDDGICHAPGSKGFSRVMREWESLAVKLVPEWRISEISVSEAFAMTLIATRDSDLFSVGVGFTQWYRHCGAGILESTDPSMFLRDHEFHLWWLSAGRDSEEKNPDSSSEGEFNEEAEAIGFDLRQFLKDFIFASYGRCLFTTNSAVCASSRDRTATGKWFDLCQCQKFSSSLPKALALLSHLSAFDLPGVFLSSPSSSQKARTQEVPNIDDFLSSSGPATYRHLLPATINNTLNYWSSSLPSSSAICQPRLSKHRDKHRERQAKDFRSHHIPKPKMTGLRLLDLPVEILIKIIQLAIPPMVLPEDLHVVGWMTNPNERAATIAIMGTTDIGCLKQHLKAALSELSKIFPDLKGRIVLLEDLPGHLAISTNEQNDISFKFFDQRASFSWTYSQLKSQGFPADTFVDASFDLPYRLQDGEEGIPAFEVQARLIDGGLLLGIYGHHSIFDASRMDMVIKCFAQLTKDPITKLDTTSPARLNGESITSAHVPPAEDLNNVLSRCPEYRILSSPLGPTQFRAPNTETLPNNTGRIFVIQDETVCYLKDKLAYPRRNDSKHQPSTFTCLAAITWAHVTNARIASLSSSTSLAKNARLMISVDWRRRISSDAISTSSGNAIALSIASINKSTISEACTEDQETSYPALAAIARAIDEAIHSVNDDFVAARTALFRSVPDPRLAGACWGRDKQDSASVVAPDAARRAQAVFGTGSALILPETDATKFEVLVTLDVEAMEHLCNSRSWQRWIEKPGL
ncbi:heterokaryon incompatibility het-6 [Fusarium coicis]|nr:heterokaryon incompatibility het-6 [Fusarium coicis]